MSYDKSKLFSGNQKAMIKDQFNYSPAQDENYNYKKENGITSTVYLNGMITAPKNMYTPGESRSIRDSGRMG
jgi:hypothetical protein